MEPCFFDDLEDDLVAHHKLTTEQPCACKAAHLIDMTAFFCRFSGIPFARLPVDSSIDSLS